LLNVDLIRSQLLRKSVLGEECKKIFLFAFGGLIWMEEITKHLKLGNLIIGTKQTIKSLRKGTLAKIFLANNCPESIAEDIEHYAALVNLEVQKLDIACDELGAVCKKPFLISVISIPK